MRDQITPLYRDLFSQGSATIAITPSASAAQLGKFTITGLDPRSQEGGYNYLSALIGHNDIVVDTDAAGNAVSWDKLYKICSSMEVISPVFGVVYPHIHTRGAVMGHLIQVIGDGYQYPQAGRDQIAANTDADTTVDLYYRVPFSFECLAKPHETSQWVGFYDSGTFEIGTDLTTVLDGDYAGAVIKTGTLRAQAEYFPSVDRALGVPFQFRERQIAGGGSSPILKSVGIDTSLNGVKQGCGLAGLWWLTDATGIGMGGPDGVDNFTALAISWRQQKLVQNLDGLVMAQRVQQRGRTGPIAGVGTTIIRDGAGWPTTMDATTQVQNRLAANSQLMALQLIGPGRDLETSKVPRTLGDLQVDFLVTAAITTTHRFVSWELMEFTDDQVRALARGAGFQGSPRRKALRGPGTASSEDLRYTRILFQ